MTSIDEGERARAAAGEAFGRFDWDARVAHLSAAIRAFTAAGEPRRAAMACVELGETLSTLMGNQTAGRAWFARAERLVADEPDCIEQGWVAVAAMGCDVDDPAQLLAAAELALDRARRFGDVNLETKALADAGLAQVELGQVAEGMARLDEAMALACGPADDTGVAAKSVCSFFTACYCATDFERADAWTALLRRQGLMGPTPGDAMFLSAHCDSLQATSLIELGRWGDAERLLTRAKADFETVMPTSSWHPDLVLADLRTRQGRLTDSETLLLGKDQVLPALLPAARLHLARGDYDLARATARRGLRAAGDDRLRAVELLTVLVDAELAAGDVAAATAACHELQTRVGTVDIAALRARAAAARARVQAAAGDREQAVATLEDALDHLNARQLPWLRATLLLDLARHREQLDDTAAATVDAKAAAAALADLDVVLGPDDTALLDRLLGTGTAPPDPVASLARDGAWWSASHAGTTVRIRDSKGLRYLAELVAHPHTERHALDLVDRAEGVAPAGGVDRRALGDAGELVDAEARAAYRRRIEQLRAEADEALAAGHLEAAERTQAELDELVGHLAAAFGLGGRSRRAASVAERARLNVTRALRTAIARLTDALPAAAALDRQVRTGLYCVYEPVPGDVRWVVESFSRE